MNWMVNYIGDTPVRREYSITRGAVRNDLEEIKRALEEDPESINDQDKRMGVTALHIAAGDGNMSLVRFLCAQPGCDPQIMDHARRLPGELAFTIGRRDISDEIDKLVTMRLAKEEPAGGGPNVVNLPSRGPRFPSP